MDIFNVLTLIGGLSLFLFGMNIMSNSLEKEAGGKLKTILANLTNNPIKGFILGLSVTAVIQSSSATTVMVVGLVSAGVMSLHQAINIIMGANVGTTITAWILSLTGIQSDNLWIKMLKPSSFTPILAIIGIFLLMSGKSSRKKDFGMILLGFAVLMFGMETMSSSVSGLRTVPGFQNILLMFSNPILGVFAGALLTAIIQSSSASVGILQAVSSTGALTYAAAIPIIMGQNIGTCVTALLSSVGASKDAKRAAMVHLYFNLIGTVVVLSGFYGLNAILDFTILSKTTNEMGIAVVHTSFNLICTVIMLPCAKLLERLAHLTVKNAPDAEEFRLLDERLLATPALAVERCRVTTTAMAELSVDILKKSMLMLTDYDVKTAIYIREGEDKVDQYEDRIGTYIIKVSAHPLTDDDSHEATRLLRFIG
ncbi:MAG: Na/Pi cotransporter family protein, partial [Eubacteriales bacterium]|nr:Na/Pi cotransporter family protein [Eubacteriales bacterium]